MSIVGKVESLWRYPVKSMRGERLDEAFVGFAGVYGDRLFAFRHAHHSPVAATIHGTMRDIVPFPRGPVNRGARGWQGVRETKSDGRGRRGTEEKSVDSPTRSPCHPATLSPCHQWKGTNQL